MEKVEKDIMPKAKTLYAEAEQLASEKNYEESLQKFAEVIRILQAATLSISQKE